MNGTYITPRAQALAALSAVLDARQTLDEASANFRLNEADAGFVRLLLLATLRHLGQIDALLAGYLDKKLPPKRQLVMHTLRLGVAQLLLLDTPAHAAVNESILLLKGGKDDALTGVVNAVLKRIATEKPALPDCRHNLPGWLEKRWKEQYGKAVSDSICRVANTRPPLDLNTAKKHFAHGERLDDTIWRMGPDHPPVPSIEGYDSGAFFVQDFAASLPVRLLGDVQGATALDIGAAPGGKTAQLARAGATVTALDKSERRMQRLGVNLQRLQLNAQTVVADAFTYEPEAQFDLVVIDAPCSATGTWRRHPEVVHITTPDDIAELVQTQRALLARAWQWVKPGGRLLYCTCSLEREEGEDQAAWFTAHHADAQLQPAQTELPGLSPEGLLRTTPALLAEHGGMDGFFAAAFRKQ